ncbi:MAG: hydrogenase 3 maturation endopeptidase HyCI [Ardenticatenaceae bacterium]|nr:hydrogenase 3 maturation endopeptidase HyCI [Ardenticatenaceae bacterium]
MSLPSWASSLQQTLNRLSEERPLRLAVLGIGHELRGDDAVGLAVVAGLRPYLQARAEPFMRDNFLLIEAAHAPENHTGTIRKFRPTLVLLVDAAQMNEPPGTVSWLQPQQMTGLSASTHTMPPTLLMRFLQAELGCAVAFLGIQPADTTLGAGLSAVVQTAVVTIIQTIKDTLLN